MKASGESYQRGPQGANQAPPRAGKDLKDLINSDYVKKRFLEVMGEKAPAFLASVLNAMRTNPTLSKCDPNSVLSSAMVAATLDLPIDPSLGFAAIVPYNGKHGMVAQFQIMTRGFVQLALRSGQYKTINVGPIYEDEFKSYDIVSGDVLIEPVEDGYRAHDVQEKIVGYVAFFRLLNGFERIDYWPLKKIVAHGKRFSKSFTKEFSIWQTDPHAMYSKTVLKNCLSKWGILSTTMQTAMTADQAAIRDFSKPIDEQNVDYVDANDDDSTGEEGEKTGEGSAGAPPAKRPAALPAAQDAEPVPAAAAPAAEKGPEPVPANGSGGKKDAGAIRTLSAEESQEPPPVLDDGLF